MIDKIKTLLNKTNELEDKINTLNNSQSKTPSSTRFVCFSKGLLNLSFLNKNRFLIASFEVKQNSPLYFQNQIELNVPLSQNIKITLIVNNIAIYRSTRKLQTGYNQLTIMKNFIPLKDEQLELYLEVTAEENSLITLISDTLFVWGISDILNNIQYQAVETPENFTLSYLNNNTIYYSEINKETATLNSEDFTYYASGISHCFVYSIAHQNLFLFRVDINGNLFYCNFKDKYEKFITSNVSYVSCSSNESIISIAIIKNNTCYVIEMDSNFNLSDESKVESNNICVERCYLHFNNFNNKFYLIVSDKNNSNYIMEGLNPTSKNHSYINSNYTIEITAYEATLW